MLEAEKLDPLSPIIGYVATAAYLADNRIDEAIIEGQRTQQLDPHYFYLDSNLAAAYREKGNFAEAIALYTKAQEERHFPSSGLAITYARIGQQIEARKILDQLLQERQNPIRLGPDDRGNLCRVRRKRRSFPLARCRRCRTLWNATVDCISSRLWRAPSRRTFPSISATNRRCARLSFGDYGNNSGRNERSERRGSLHPQSWREATTKHPKWPRCKA